MNIRWLKRHWLTVQGSALLCVMAGMSAPVAQAAWPDTSAFSNARELSDTELSGMRGRFVDGNRIMYFGIQMTSQWRTAAGETLQAGANMFADISGKTPRVKYEPHITAVTSDSYQSSQSQQSNNTQVVNNGTGNASGVVQSIQAGGDHNAASNEFIIDIGSGRFSGFAGSGNGTSNLTTLSGAKLSVSNSNGGLSVNIDVPGQGRINQQVMSRQGLHQSVQLNSSMQQIRNVTRLQLGIQRQLNGGMNQQMQSALESARRLERL